MNVMRVMQGDLLVENIDSLTCGAEKAAKRQHAMRRPHANAGSDAQVFEIFH